ncbi:28 kDa heat- and acid-stable phosphoprotein-like [Palaemon carinicauda]|uniref:28 kDa heat- and acid-stable phosphoprotein-like n=1 Tax=Palaemon carinicauda TaxID=392227 RepID=UPI0035B5EF9B
MPKGKHKGGRRQFTNFEALEEQKKKEEKEKQWRKTQGETDSEEEAEAEEGKSSASSGESESEEEEEDQKETKPKGVSALIETENPNRIVTKAKKVTQISTTASGAGKPQLSRREREEIEKQRATAHYRKMHAEGKTEEARADLARLAIIKQQREEAAKKREDERIAREEAAAAKREQTAKALNKKRS